MFARRTFIVGSATMAAVSANAQGLFCQEIGPSTKSPTILVTDQMVAAGEFNIDWDEFVLMYRVMRCVSEGKCSFHPVTEEMQNAGRSAYHEFLQANIRQRTAEGWTGRTTSQEKTFWTDLIRAIYTAMEQARLGHATG